MPDYRMQHQPQWQPQPDLQPPPEPPKKPFRWWLILVPLVLLFCIWLGHGLRPSFRFEDVMDALGVPMRSHESYTQLAVLGVVVAAAAAICRILGKGGRD